MAAIIIDQAEISRGLRLNILWAVEVQRLSHKHLSVFRTMPPSLCGGVIRRDRNDFRRVTIPLRGIKTLRNIKNLLLGQPLHICRHFISWTGDA